MVESTGRLIEATALGLRGIGVATFIFGAFTAAQPAHSIALYQALMAFLNWRVEPIDKPLEIGRTRLMGLAMVALSLALFWILMRPAR